MDTKRVSYIGKTPTALDWARLAAFIDGEGWIGIAKSLVDERKVG